MEAIRVRLVHCTAQLEHFGEKASTCRLRLVPRMRCYSMMIKLLKLFHTLPFVPQAEKGWSVTYRARMTTNEMCCAFLILSFTTLIMATRPDLGDMAGLI